MADTALHWCVLDLKQRSRTLEAPYSGVRRSGKGCVCLSRPWPVRACLVSSHPLLLARICHLCTSTISQVLSPAGQLSREGLKRRCKVGESEFLESAQHVYQGARAGRSRGLCCCRAVQDGWMDAGWLFGCLADWLATWSVGWGV